MVKTPDVSIGHAYCGHCNTLEKETFECLNCHQAICLDCMSVFPHPSILCPAYELQKICSIDEEQRARLAKFFHAGAFIQISYFRAKIHGDPRKYFTNMVGQIQEFLKQSGCLELTKEELAVLEDLSLLVYNKGLE